MNFEYDYAATPLNPDEIEGLIPSHIVNMVQLNNWESENIYVAEQWAFKNINKFTLDSDYIRNLHKRMFNKTWRWAGKFRLSEKNIGVPYHHISMDLLNLCHDVECWIKNNAYSKKEIFARLHHKMVTIHPFANGNGRHGRLFTDLAALFMGEKKFMWGSQFKVSSKEQRDKYINALRLADKGNIQPLIDFMG